LPEGAEAMQHNRGRAPRSPASLTPAAATTVVLRDPRRLSRVSRKDGGGRERERESRGAAGDEEDEDDEARRSLHSPATEWSYLYLTGVAAAPMEDRPL